jgi:mannose-6-phosphate isomerase-like protein (cupin superfamily)
MVTKAQFVEPTGEDKPAGFLTYKRSKSPYERFVEEEGLPVVYGIGVYDTRQLELKPWKRLGGRGAYLYLDGLSDVKGMFVQEVPAGGASNPSKQMFDEFFLVIEGRGTTEVWREGSSKKQTFEWQPGTLFMVPLNANHRHVNATSSPALLLSSNNAPPVFNIYQSRQFIFENPYDGSLRMTDSDDFFKPQSDLERDEVRGRAAIRSNVFPDIVNCELPLDNQRAPGYRRIQPYFNGFIADGGTGGFISQYPSGRYSKAHYHQSGAVLVCLRGKGYSYNWRIELGPKPWETGHGDDVKIQEYIPGGLVAAAPGGGNWFHQHFSSGASPLRVINYWGGPTGRWGLLGTEEDTGDGEVKSGNIYGINEGGRTIHYWMEDPHIRDYYADRLHQEGVSIDMDPKLYAEPK